VGAELTRVAVFIDYQNVYCGVRDAFGWRHGHYTLGQVFPRRLGLLLTQRGRSVDSARQLEKVMVFRGEPSAGYSRVGQAACQRQVRFWSAQGLVEPVTRPLKYYPVGSDASGQTRWEGREKGVDVLLALAMVMGAMRDEYDVAVLVSADTDLGPALETVCALGKRCEVAAWKPTVGYGSRLGASSNVWCHWLTESDYRLVEDDTDYTRPQPGEPPTT
jgi:uncharacterized LabA/DUF88 family protein